MNFKLLLRSATTTGICMIFGLLGAIALQNGVKDWYPALQKPWFTAPDFIYGPIWIVMHFMVGLSAGLVWSKGFYHRWVKTALYHFGFIIMLNAFWFLLFFGLHETFLALLAILGTLTITFFTIKWFKIVNPWSAYLLIPYAVWMLYLSCFTFEFWRIN